jgi:hypothetical protein
MANGTPFNEEELEVINDTTLTHTLAAKKINRSVNSIFSKRYQLGLIDKCKGHRKPWTKEEIDAVLDFDKPLNTLAYKLNRTRSSISSMRHELSKVA